LSRARLLVAPDGPPWRRWQTRAPGPFECALHGAVSHAELVRDPPNAPAEVSDQIDRLTHTRVMLGRRTMRPSTARLQARNVGSSVPLPPSRQHGSSNA